MATRTKDRECPHCGAKMVTYRHSLSRTLMGAFRKALEAADVMGYFDIAACGLNNSERQNLSKLKYWGIIRKVGDPSGKGGRWRITVGGLAFAEGIRKYHKTAITYRDAAIEFDGEEVSIDTSHFNMGKRMFGTWGGDSVPERDYADFAKLVAADHSHCNNILSDDYSLENINAALDDLEAGRIGRPVINMSLA